MRHWSGSILAIITLAGAVAEAKELPNGPMINGPMINGPMINGPMINGPMINGPMINGPMINGSIENGYVAGQMKGSNGTDVPLYFESHRSSSGNLTDPDAVHYYVVSWGANKDPLCGWQACATGWCKREAIATPGSWWLPDEPTLGAGGPASTPSDSDGDGIYDSPEVNLSCVGLGAVAKCVELGYHPWRPDSRPLHTACVRMVRADYCGDNHGFTTAGTMIDVQDIGLPGSAPFQSLGGGLGTASSDWEAVWTSRGPACVNVSAARSYNSDEITSYRSAHAYCAADFAPRSTSLPWGFVENAQQPDSNDCGNVFNLFYDTSSTTARETSRVLVDQRDFSTAKQCVASCPGGWCGGDGCGKACPSCSGGRVCGSDSVCEDPAATTTTSSGTTITDPSGQTVFSVAGSYPYTTIPSSCVPGEYTFNTQPYHRYRITPTSCTGNPYVSVQGPCSCLSGYCGSCECVAAGGPDQARVCVKTGNQASTWSYAVEDLGSTCTPSCSGKQCGSDGCGGTCGACGSGTTCGATGQCEACTCDGRQCGQNACGQSCGSCAAGQECTSAGQCTAPPPDGTGTGLLGEYYDDPGFSRFKLRRTDAAVDFNWGSGAPDASMGVDQFAVRWTGQLEPKYSETYSFSVDRDDGMRLWVNGQLVIDQWADGNTSSSGSIALVAGTKVDLRLDYYENGGGAIARLYWQSPSRSKQIVPASQLYPPTFTAAEPSGSGLVGAYYAGRQFERLVLERTDTAVDFAWAAAPATGLPSDGFSVRWTGHVLPPVTGTYTFTTSTDDGVRLWVGGQKLVDDWADHGTTSRSGTVSLTAGVRVPVLLEYYENGGDAVARLSWTVPGQGSIVVSGSALSNCAGEGAGCSTGALGVCGAGVYQCSGGALSCTQPVAVSPTTESCNGKDDDCDGSVDEGLSGANCSTGKLGVCSSGTTQCNGTAIVCNQKYQPTTETCNGKDDDCDGTVDQGDPGGGVACTVSGKLGACAQGVKHCTSGSLLCQQVVQPSAEVAGNGIDDDCDGFVDEQVTAADASGVVALEAEEADARTSTTYTSWAPASLDGYSGTGALAAMPAIGRTFSSGAGPRLDFLVSLSAGTYYVWLRTSAPGSAEVDLLVDGSVKQYGVSVPSGGGWRWTTLDGSSRLTLSVSAGDHVLGVSTRDDGVAIDRVVLTQDPAYDPTGAFPANGHFDLGWSPWVTSGTGWTRDTSSSRGYYARFDSTSRAGAVTQDLTLPATATTLSYLLNVSTNESTSAVAKDFLYVELRAPTGNLIATLDTVSNRDRASNSYTFTERALDLSAYAGQTVRLQLRGTNDGSYATTFKVDDVTVR